MSDFPSGSSASSSTKSPAYADALQRARQIASKIKPSSESATSPVSSSSSSVAVGQKRPLDLVGDGPESKKSIVDPFGAQLAARVNMIGEGAGVPTMGPTSEETIMVPDKMVGLIIGRGGEQITRLQNETGCKIQMAPDSQGMPERQCTIKGTPAAIAEARAAIDRIISSEGTGPRGGGGFSSGPPGGPVGSSFEMMVPGHKVGLVIGKGGETIKQLQEQSGAKIIIIQDTPEAANEKPLRITGSADAIESAKRLVLDIVNQGDDREMMGGFGRGRGRGRGRGAPFGLRGGRGGGRGGFGPPGGGGQWSGGPQGEYGGGQCTDYVLVPSNKCGLIIGKGGETIKNINQSTGAHCEVDKSAPPDARDKNFIIRGSPDAVERAKAMIMDKLGMPGGGGPNNGGYGGYGGGSGPQGGSWGGQYQQGGYQQDPNAGAPQSGQADYSQQWAEYYRSMGLVKEAEAIEMRTRGTNSQPQPPSSANGAGPNGASGAAVPDYSAQWAEYYRSLGKVKEAEAIEVQMKQKTYPNSQYGGYYGQSQGAVPQAPASGYGYPGYAYGQPGGE